MNIADLGRVETYRDAARQSTRVHFPLYSQLDYEIREGLRLFIRKNMAVPYGVTGVEEHLNGLLGELLSYLHSQGVVIKVVCDICGGSRVRPEDGYKCSDCDGEGYSGVESLI
ncbi:hypothetical protein LCGC14_0387540 [marine sediment metagenome]|uniref:Uncharacterized protein n=1 Tax=marine sediment metagenome TaxID=412755 RepID=A0A0F9TIH7_9ZZZZ